jgi:hypothetical protein
MRKLFFVLAGSAVLTATSASAAAGNSCIRHDDIYTWTTLDDRTLILEN